MLVNDTKLGGVGDMRLSLLQRDLEKLEKCDDKNLLEFSKGRCWVLFLGRNTPWHQQRLRSTWKAFCKEHRLTMGQWCALAEQKNKGTLGCTRQSAASRSRELFLECPVLFWDPQEKGDMELQEAVQQKVSDTWEEAEKSGVAHPRGMKAQQDDIHVCKYPAVGNEEEPGSAQWWQLTGQETMGKYWNNGNSI